MMFFCDSLKVPPLIGPIKITENHAFRPLSAGL
jgi:hypothetical protein